MNLDVLRFGAHILRTNALKTFKWILLLRPGDKRRNVYGSREDSVFYSSEDKSLFSPLDFFTWMFSLLRTCKCPKSDFCTPCKLWTFQTKIPKWHFLTKTQKESGIQCDQPTETKSHQKKSIVSQSKWLLLAGRTKSLPSVWKKHILYSRSSISFPCRSQRDTNFYFPLKDWGFTRVSFYSI